MTWKFQNESGHVRLLLLLIFFLGISRVVGFFFIDHLFVATIPLWEK